MVTRNGLVSFWMASVWIPVGLFLVSFGHNAPKRKHGCVWISFGILIVSFRNNPEGPHARSNGKHNARPNLFRTTCRLRLEKVNIEKTPN